MASVRIYLDYNATAPLSPEVRDWLIQALELDLFGNASSVHWSGQRARKHLEQARTRIAQLTLRKPSEIIFTSGGTEANNLALRGALLGDRTRSPRLLVSAVEHPSVLEPARRLAREGVDLEILPVDRNGALDLEALSRALQRPTTLVSVMAVNNETGVESPVSEVIRLAHAAGARVHVDAVQAAGKRPLPVEADLFTLSGHKLGAPSGIGALISREALQLRPELLGGPQERGYRGGTEPIVLATALSIALERAEAEREIEIVRLLALRDRLEAGLRLVPEVSIVGSESARAPGTTSAIFSGIEGDALLQALDLAGIAASSGSACSSGSLEPSHVLLAMGFSSEDAKSAVRFSTGARTRPEDIDALLSCLPDLLGQLRR